MRRGGGVGSGSARECESRSAAAVECGSASESERGWAAARERDAASVGGASATPRDRQDFVRACDRATRRSRRFLRIGGRDDEMIPGSRSRRDDRRRGRVAASPDVAGTRDRPRQARSIVARPATSSDEEIAEEWRRARSVREGRSSPRQGETGGRAGASERARGERAETMAPGHGGVHIVRVPPRARAGWNFGSACKKKISLWFDGAGRGRHSQREVSFFASPT